MSDIVAACPNCGDLLRTSAPLSSLEHRIVRELKAGPKTMNALVAAIYGDRSDGGPLHARSVISAAFGSLQGKGITINRPGRGDRYTSYYIVNNCWEHTEDLHALPNDIRVMVLSEAELLQQKPNLILARICRDYYNRQKREHGGN